MMPWYESQLVGTIIGAGLGFFLAYIPTAIERRRSRRALLSLMRTEIAAATEQLKEKVEQAERMLAAAAEGKACQIFTSERRLDEVFTANLANLTSIQSQHAVDLLKFHQIISRYTGLVNALSQDEVGAGGDTSDFCRALRRLIEFMEEGIATGERITMKLTER
jgi:hypothetical protein